MVLGQLDTQVEKIKVDLNLIHQQLLKSNKQNTDANINDKQ